MKAKQVSKIGIIGTGFIGSGLKKIIEKLPDMVVAQILTQRNLDSLPAGQGYTNSVQELIDHSGLIVECNGNPIYATDILIQVMDAEVPIVTMDAELHITSGSYLSTKGFITEAEGDQPGTLASFNKYLIGMGFKPLVYGNLKGFLNLNPTPDEMQFWAEKQGISIKEVTGATDGTKIQVEQALVANGLGAAIAKQGLCGFETEDIDRDAERLAQIAQEVGQPISDYLLRRPGSGYFPKGVFITATHDPNQTDALEYLKLGEGPIYTLIRNYYLCHLEIPKTIREVLKNREVLLDNGLNPTASVCSIAKMELQKGTKIDWSNRHTYVRGEALTIKDAPHHVPIGLMNGAIIKRKVEQGQMLEVDDVELPDSKAKKAWDFTLSLVK